MLDYRHFILRQCASFIRADYLRATEGFYSSQLADDRMVFRHLGDTDREYDRHYSDQSFRNCRDSQAYCQHKRIDDNFRIEGSAFQQTEREDDNANSKNQPS